MRTELNSDCPRPRSPETEIAVPVELGSRRLAASAAASPPAPRAPVVPTPCNHRPALAQQKSAPAGCSTTRHRPTVAYSPVGGKDQPIRGGVEAAKYNEGGGRNADGSDGFKIHRSGWEMPVHQLLVKHNVSIVFHGHDHVFAREELDGVVYQLVPQPGATRTGDPRNAGESGYVHGKVLDGAGYVRVNVAADDAVVEYVPSLLREDAAGTRRNAIAAYSYRVPGAAR